MKIEQLYTGCLSEAAYYLESDGEAAVIDPLRDPAPYLERAAADGAQIKYILETHFHADFVSGHLDLAAATGAQIVFGPTAKADFPIHEARDGEFLRLGRHLIQVLHTPGHTMESASFLLYDLEGNPYAIFSGDTLFINEVGRPDLAVPTNHTREDLAGLLYDSITDKYLPLPDHVLIYPGHGAGSACGKNIGKELHSTMGQQRATNYALNPELTREQFVTQLLNGILPPPQYFPKNAMMNKHGYRSFEEVHARGTKALDVEAFAQLRNGGALVIDARSKDEFAAGHIPGAWFIGIDGDFAPWVGALVGDLGQSIVLVVPEGRAGEVVTRLARVGYDNCQGFLAGGIAAWQGAGLPLAQVARIAPQQLQEAAAGAQVVDVRREAEFEGGHWSGAYNLPLDYLVQRMGELPVDGNYLVHCKGGYRSMIAASILLARGYAHVTDVSGGWDAIAATLAPQGGAMAIV